MTFSRTNQLIIAAAESIGVAWEPLSEESTDFLLRLVGPQGSAVISKTRSPFLTAVAQTLSNNKSVARSLLAGAGLPVVQGVLLDDATPDFDAEAVLKRWPRVVVKPNWGNRALGVAGPLRTSASVRRAVRRAQSLDLDDEALIEPFVDGANIRACVVGGRCIAATRIVRPVLLGDGQASGRELVERLNADPRRLDWRHPSLLPLDRVEVDEGLEAAFGLHGLQLDDVVPTGVGLELLTDEAETVDFTEELDPRWAGYAEQACALLGVDVGGVDFRGPLEAFEGPPTETSPGAVLLEVNVVPALHIHALPTQGEPRPVFEAFVAYCLGLPGAPAPCATVGAH